MNDLNQHYRDLLGLDDSWNVDEVDLDLAGTQVVIHRSFAGSELSCLECREACSRADTAAQRSWRHLDTIQFATEIRAAVPRCRCEKCGGKTTRVPWADKHSRFTLMFEAFAIRVLQVATNVKRAAQLLGLSWDAAHRIPETAVERGLQRRDAEVGHRREELRSGTRLCLGDDRHRLVASPRSGSRANDGRVRFALEIVDS